MPDTDVPDKSVLRARMRTMRETLAPDEARRLSEAACAHILHAKAWADAACVALYIAVRGECDTALLAQDAWKQGKTLLLPLCSREERGHMRLVSCSGPDSLRPGPYGIPEPLSPAPDHSPPVPDIILVPGVAFTRDGLRLGQGGGYYDRLFGNPAYSASLRIGFAYSFQIVGSLPHEEWDMPVQALATEQGLLWIPR